MLSILRVTFLELDRLYGDISFVELNYNYQLKKVLKQFRIKPIEVFIEDLKDLSLAGQIDFYVKKALDSY